MSEVSPLQRSTDEKSNSNNSKEEDQWVGVDRPSITLKKIENNYYQELSDNKRGGSDHPKPILISESSSNLPSPKDKIFKKKRSSFAQNIKNVEPSRTEKSEKSKIQFVRASKFKGSVVNLGGNQSDRDRDDVYLTNTARMKGKLLFDPEGTFFRRWNAINSIVIMYIAFVLPFKFSFLKSADYETWDMVDRFFDIVFLLDIIFTFFVPYFKGSRIIVSHKKIAKNYLTGPWFWMDLISIIPFDLMFGYDNNYSILLRIWKLPRFYKLLKIARLFKNLKKKKKGNTFLKKIRNNLSGKQAVLQLFPIFTFIFIMCHCAACAWHFFSWWDTDPDTWVSRNNYRDEAAFDRYIASMYFIFQTITTVGYGDIGVGTKVEFSIVIMLMFAGVLFYSNILSELLDMIEKKLEAQERIQQKYHMLRQLNGEVKIKGSLIREMKRVIDVNESEMEEQNLRPDFSGVNKNDSEQLMYEGVKEKFKGMPLFMRREKEFVIEFGLSMKEKEFHDGSKIYEKGDNSNYFYLIREGTVKFCLPEEQSVSFIQCKEGYFGEQELLRSLNLKESDEKRQYTVFAETDCKLYLLSKPAFFNLFMNRDRKFAKGFIAISQKRDTLFRKAELATRKLMVEVLDEVRKEMNAANPFLKFQRIVRGEKFRRKYLGHLNHLTNKQKRIRKKGNLEFLEIQKKRRDPNGKKKKTHFVQTDKNGNIIMEKKSENQDDWSLPQNNNKIEMIPEEKTEKESVKKMPALGQVGQEIKQNRSVKKISDKSGKLKAQIKREQALQNKKKKRRRRT